MTPQEVIDLARKLTYTNSDQVTDADAVSFLNIVYTDMANRIISDVNEDYFYQKWTTDSLLGQSEYPLPIVGANPGLQKVLQVEYKPSTDYDYPVVCELARYGEFHKSSEYLKDERAQDKPLVVIADESIFLYPVPSENVTDGIVIHGIEDVKDIVIGDIANDVLQIPKQYHRVLSIGMKPYIFSSRGLVNEKNDSINEYEREMNKLIGDLSDRYISPIVTNLPYLKHFE